MRAGLTAILRAEPDLRVVGEAGQAVGLAGHTAEVRLDVVLLAVPVLEHDDVRALRSLRRRNPDAAFLLLGTSADDDSIHLALSEGAAGYLLHTSPQQKVAEAIRAVHAGERVFSRAIQERLIGAFLERDRRDAAPPVLRELTDRQAEVFRELARGLSNAEIGARLHLSEATVKKYITRILATLGLRDRVQAVVFAHQNGVTGTGRNGHSPSASR